MMARPQKRTVDYFPHYVNHGKTLLILQNEFGNDGYSFWFKLLSLLCKTDGQVYDYNNYASWRLLLAETSVNEDIANNMLRILAEIDAIDKELYLRKFIWVQNLVDNLEDVYKRRTNGSTPRRPVIVDNNVVLHPISVDHNLINDNNKPQTKLNKTKLNKTSSLSSKRGDLVKQVFAQIDKIRGYRPPKRKPEAAAIIRMLNNYTPDQIINTWETLKQDKFWQKQELFMMTVESQIGAVQSGTHKQDTKSIKATGIRIIS